MFKTNIRFTQNKKKLKVILIVSRFLYNFLKILTLNFTPVFLLSFVGTMVDIVENINKDKHLNANDVNYIIESLHSVFIYILLIQIVLATCVCVCYELMKSTKAKLKKIDRAQSMPKKVGIRYYNRNLVRYIFR